MTQTYRQTKLALETSEHGNGSLAEAPLVCLCCSTLHHLLPKSAIRHHAMTLHLLLPIPVAWVISVTKTVLVKTVLVATWALLLGVRSKRQRISWGHGRPSHSRDLECVSCVEGLKSMGTKHEGYQQEGKSPHLSLADVAQQSFRCCCHCCTWEREPCTHTREVDSGHMTQPQAQGHRLTCTLALRGTQANADPTRCTMQVRLRAPYGEVCQS